MEFTTVTNSPPSFDGGDDDDDGEETLSLRDLPITATASSTTSPHSRAGGVDVRNTAAANNNRATHRPSSSSSDSFFEFLTSIEDNSDVTASPADDVILDGHILPYAPPPPRCPRRSLSLNSAEARSQSISNAAANPSSAAVIRPSRSLNGRKLRRSDTKTEAASVSYSRSSSSSSSVRYRSNNTKINPIKSSWYYWLIFGLPARIPAEKELKDMKHRRSRRNIPPPSFFPGDRSSAASSSSASWRVLNVLSCKSHSSVDVINTPPPIIP